MPKIILFVEQNNDKIYISDNIVCYVVPDTLGASKIQEICHIGKMVLASGDRALEVCRQYRLDGVVKKLDTAKPVKPQLRPLREALTGKTLGVIIPPRRHEAMLAGEVEPEFIAFASAAPLHDAEVISWYNDLFLIPSVWVAEDNATAGHVPAVDFVMVRAKNFENFGC